jgi:hypothetical protein
MTTQSSSLIVSLLASLWVAGAAPVVAAPHSSTGEVSANATSFSKKKRVIVVCDAIVKNAPAGTPATSGKADDVEVIHFEDCIPASFLKDPELDVVVEGECPICPGESDETGG